MSSLLLSMLYGLEKEYANGFCWDLQFIFYIHIRMGLLFAWSCYRFSCLNSNSRSTKAWLFLDGCIIGSGLTSRQHWSSFIAGLLIRFSFWPFCRGEIAVMCQDAKLLKERFDSGAALGEPVPFGQRKLLLSILQHVPQYHQHIPGSNSWKWQDS